MQTYPIPLVPPAWADLFGEDDAGIFAECEVRGARLVWRWICPGRFVMGSPEEEAGRWADEGPQHEVVITRGFWMGETPVTQVQWEAVMGTNPSEFQGADRPVERVSWLDALEFRDRLNQLLPGLGVALPTEAQWEYACRAGTQGAFGDGSACTIPEGRDPALEKLGWFGANSSGETQEVKLKAPNGWGLYDMHGNVWEWCRDVWDAEAYSKRGARVEDPETVGDDRDARRVVRGGSWSDLARDCRAAFRIRLGPVYRFRDLGLRLSAGQELQAGTAGAAEPPTKERSDAPERRSRG